jgi:GNAT superfamily N-acetyltransferase
VTVVIRAAEDRDIPRLQSIEIAADALLLDLLHPTDWERAPSGEARASMSGFILVADSADGELVGFAHVLVGEGYAHLEQLSVIPERGRQGLGRALVEEAKAEAGRRGFGQLTLRTYADVRWNAPFYATCGFVETEPDTPLLRELAETETCLGLVRYGRRIQMSASLTR